MTATLPPKMSYLVDNAPVSPATPLRDERVLPDYQAAMSNMRTTPTSIPPPFSALTMNLAPITPVSTSSASSQQAQQVSTFTPTPLPEPGPSPLNARKRKPIDHTDNITIGNDKLDAIFLAIRRRDSRLHTEMTSLRADVAALSLRLELQHGIANQNEETRSCTCVVQQDILNGVSYLSSTLAGHRDRVQRASDVMNEILNS